MHDARLQRGIAVVAEPLGQRRGAFIEKLLDPMADRRLLLGIGRGKGLCIEQRMQQRRLLTQETSQFGQIGQAERQRIPFHRRGHHLLAKPPHMLGQWRQDRLAKQVGLAWKRAEKLHLGHSRPPRYRRRRRPAIAPLAKLGIGGSQQLPADLHARPTRAAPCRFHRSRIVHGHAPSCQPRSIVSIH